MKINKQIKYHEFKLFITILLILFILFPLFVSAHQPKIVEGSITEVVDPDISKAYYGALSGEPHFYILNSSVKFDFYANLLVPDRPGQKKDISAEIFEAGKENIPIAFLDGKNFNWEPYYEEFGADNYFKGPEFKKELPSGNYQIRVWSSDNDSRYVLAIGEAEDFSLSEIANSLRLIPELKRDFFNSSPFSFLKSSFGILYIIAMFFLAFAAGFILDFVLKRFNSSYASEKMRNNIKTSRSVRLIFGLVMLVLGIYTWSFIILFFAGFCFFETIFSRNLFCAITDKIRNIFLKANSPH